MSLGEGCFKQIVRVELKSGGEQEKSLHRHSQSQVRSLLYFVPRCDSVENAERECIGDSVPRASPVLQLQVVVPLLASGGADSEYHELGNCRRDGKCSGAEKPGLVLSLEAAFAVHRGALLPACFALYPSRASIPPICVHRGLLLHNDGYAV